MAATLQFANDLLPKLEQAAWEYMLRVAQRFEDRCKEVVGVPNTGVRVKRKRGKGSYTIYPHPAPKGSPPRKRTGWGQRNIRQVRDRAGMNIQIGVSQNAFYMDVLEKKGWPWLRYTLEKYKAEFQGLSLSER